MVEPGGIIVETYFKDDQAHGKAMLNRYTIDACGLTKSFGGMDVLRGLTLQIAPGEIFGLIGPSGSGKSTAVQLLCGHLRPSSGTATVLGEPPATFSAAARRRIGYLSQNFSLSLDLTVEQNIAFVAGLYGITPRAAPVRAALELTELWEARNRLVRQTSGGMQRRVALAAAIVHDPDLLFADEPTANLDPILRTHLWKNFRARAQRGGTLLITTQYIDEAEYCDRVGLMYDGTLIAQGHPEELRRRAFGGDIVEIVLNSTNLPDAASLASLSGIRMVEAPLDQPLRVTVADAEAAIPLLLETLAVAQIPVRSVRHYRPTFDDVFIRLIELYRAEARKTGENDDASIHTTPEHSRQRTP